VTIPAESLDVHGNSFEGVSPTTAENSYGLLGDILDGFGSFAKNTIAVSGSLFDNMTAGLLGQHAVAAVSVTAPVAVAAAVTAPVAVLSDDIKLLAMAAVSRDKPLALVVDHAHEVNLGEFYHNISNAGATAARVFEAPSMRVSA